MGKATVYFDDLDDSELGRDAKPVKFSYEGKNYSIYLSETNKTELDKVLGKYIEKAELDRPSSASSSSAASSEDAEEKKAARVWAQSTGFKFKANDGTMKSVGDKGRLHPSVIEAYRKAND